MVLPPDRSVNRSARHCRWLTLVLEIRNTTRQKPFHLASVPRRFKRPSYPSSEHKLSPPTDSIRSNLTHMQLSKLQQEWVSSCTVSFVIVSPKLCHDCLSSTVSIFNLLLGAFLDQGDPWSSGEQRARYLKIELSQ